MLYVCKIGLGVIFITPEFEIISFFLQKSILYDAIQTTKNDNGSHCRSGGRRWTVLPLPLESTYVSHRRAFGLCELPHHVTLLCHLDAQLSFAKCDV